MSAELFDWSPDVIVASKQKRPMVALESTIISHGLPYPTNIEVASEVEDIVRKAGAVPATIAIQQGRVQIGLDDAGLEFFARADGVIKASRRDLAALIARGGSGATTVAATMLLAERAGLQVFATGGIGGVHRNGEDSLDISADLYELSMSQVMVVCAGVKSILDIGRTLEHLETLGVAVIGYQTDQFPAFYSRESGFPVPARCDSIVELATAFRAQCSLGIASGLLVVNPIPLEHEIPRKEMEPIIEAAERERVERGITGSEVTPFLLARIADLSKGRSIRANRALIVHNAQLAAELSVELHRQNQR